MRTQKATKKVFAADVSKKRIRNGERSTSTKSKAQTIQAAGLIATMKASAKTDENASTTRIFQKKVTI